MRVSPLASALGRKRPWTAIHRQFAAALAALAAAAVAPLRSTL
jgi:hypothetical protein